eukprot:m.54880 g.54880  ORF g.54880 m.54880 type:complete len:53 (+) comp13649_c0_seq1:151-309(+)
MRGKQEDQLTAEELCYSVNRLIFGKLLTGNHSNVSLMAEVQLIATAVTTAEG